MTVIFKIDGKIVSVLELGTLHEQEVQQILDKKLKMLDKRLHVRDDIFDNYCGPNPTDLHP